ncbi:MAG: Gfo/Idh/MocA family oxidoreductase [Treponema sp.]|jgi:predicted dehydrogenase|nr:Gfo/Idh/MocA family oxidoreductase [Treponema sp.]
MVQKKIGVGMVGTGFMCKAHSNAYKTIPYMFQPEYEIALAEIGGTSDGSASAGAKRYGFEKSSIGWKELINNPDVSLVDVCTPDHFHIQPVLDAIEKGKHVLCEKPIALNAEDAAKMLKAAKKAGVVHASSFNYRFMAPVRLAYEMIRQGVIGTIYHMYVHYFQEGGANPENLYENTWYARPPHSGILQGIGTHAIDQARFLAGEIATVTGIASIDVKQRPGQEGGKKTVKIEDSARALVEFESGATGVIECSAMAWGRRNQLYWEIYGSKGSLIFDLEEPNYLKVYLAEWNGKSASGFMNINVNLPGHPFTDIWWPGGHNTGWEHGHINMIAHLLSCINSGEKVEPLGATFEDGFKSAAMVDAIRLSSKEERRIDFKKLTDSLLR